MERSEPPVPMYRRLLASLLLCAALLSQALSPAARGVVAGGAAREFCDPAHHRGGPTAAAAERGDGRNTPAPADKSHDHQNCSFCQTGFSDAVASAPEARAVSLFTPWRIAQHSRRADVALVTPTRHVAAARAPPSKA